MTIPSVFFKNITGTKSETKKEEAQKDEKTKMGFLSEFSPKILHTTKVKQKKRMRLKSKDEAQQ